MGVTWLYFLCIMLNYASLGGMFAIFPVAVQNIYGLKHGPQIYVWVLLGSSLASLVNTVNTAWLVDIIGFQSLFYLGTATQIATLGILYKFKEDLDVENLMKHNGLKEKTTATTAQSTIEITVVSGKE